MEEISTYEDIGTRKKDAKTSKEIRELLSNRDRISKIERKIVNSNNLPIKKSPLDKSTFLTAAAIILGNTSQVGFTNTHEEIVSILKKVKATGYPLKQFENMREKESLNYFKDLKSEITSKLPEY